MPDADRFAVAGDTPPAYVFCTSEEAVGPAWSIRLLRRNSHREALATFRATALQNLTARRRAHPCAKPVGAFPATVARLKCSLHCSPLTSRPCD